MREYLFVNPGSGGQVVLADTLGEPEQADLSILYICMKETMLMAHQRAISFLADSTESLRKGEKPNISKETKTTPDSQILTTRGICSWLAYAECADDLNLY